MKKTHGSNFSNKKGKLTSNEMGKQNFQTTKVKKIYIQHDQNTKVRKI